MKKYFLFDNEPIKGWTYFLRIMLSHLLIIILIGFWLAASTSYKRAGAFGWKKDVRIACSVTVPIFLILNIMSNEIEFTSPTLLIIAFLSSIVHLTLWFKNGNK
tara:strand:+ start:365 stop:676 length:312 start_codon:yes stop_codon:yes gene_type:complete